MSLKEADPQIADLIEKERQRQHDTLELIASENHVSSAVLEAENGRVALERIGTVSPSLIMLDLAMPEMNGLDLVKHLRQNPELASLKVIMVTTETEVDHIVSALEAGANEYVMKPFTKDIIKGKLEMVGILPVTSE